MLYQARGKTVEQGEGYLLVYCPEYPRAKPNGYVLEHRLVMANYLGRPLEPQEHIHHINGDKKDNRIENLEIVSNAEHRKKHWKHHTQEDIDRLAKISRERAAKVKIPRKMIPCACGCGEMVWNYTDHGRPKKYVQGHNQRGKSWRWKKNEQK